MVLQHAAWEGPGLIGLEAEARGLRLDVRRLDRGDRVPEADDVDGLVVMGGPMGAYEDGKHPILASECRLMGQLARNDQPVLGVCLGSQLLAKALGESVFPGETPEIGFGAVELTALGTHDPLFAQAGEIIPVFHWHGDTFSLPKDAVLLASSVQYTQQAFRFGSCVYGLQFHVEADSKTWLRWQKHLQKDVIEEFNPKQSLVEQIGRQVIANFFDIAL